MPRYQIVNRTKETLRKMGTPGTVPGGNLQTVPFVLWDTQTYVSGTTTTLNYFTAVQNDPSLGNMPGGGVLPIDTWLTIQYMLVDVLLAPSGTATGANGVWDDMSGLMWTGRPFHELVIQNKDYAVAPLSFFHSSGGITGFGFSDATTTVAGSIELKEYAGWGIQDGGFYVGGAIQINPLAGFRTTLNWPTAVTLVAGNTLVRVCYLGTVSRPIL